MDGWMDGRMDEEGGREGGVVDGRGECGLVGWVLGLALHSHSDRISLTITPLALHPPNPPSSPSLPPLLHPHPRSLTHSLSLHALAVCLWLNGWVCWLGLGCVGAWLVVLHLTAWALAPWFSAWSLVTMGVCVVGLVSVCGVCGW